jgi:hypothetical protein
MFLVEAQKVVDKSWDLYSSGGGCYHGMKEFTTLKGTVVAVEMHAELGGAQMYHDGNMGLCNAEQVAEDDNWSNYIILAWLNIKYDEQKQDYNDYGFSDFLNIFPSDAQKDIIESMLAFAKIYDEYMYN